MTTEPETLTPTGEHCPHCPDQGWYAVPIGIFGDSEQIQCEWCYSNPRSVFNLQQATEPESFSEYLDRTGDSIDTYDPNLADHNNQTNQPHQLNYT